MASTKKKETRDEIISRVAQEYNITPKEPSSKGTVIASSKGSQRTYKANRTAEEQKQVNQSIAQQYGNAHWEKKKQEGTYNYKWYAGAAPTASETMAQIFRQSSDDEGFFNKLSGLFDEETQNSGSTIYSPYRQATNYKAIEGLRALGVDVPDVVTSDWISNMQSIYASQARTTATGYNAAAPTKSSTVENDIAYWLESLEDAEGRTGLAEQQVQSLYDEVKYWTERGYSDSEIAKRVKNDFSTKYDVLDDMDSARTSHEAVRLNRAIDYNGDDTIYGMIWAARNNGGSGDYFQDAVHQRLGQGALYQRDPASEAARDPSSYESYDPYSQGSTLHEMNRKYGVNAFSREWLDANRSMLADPEQAEDWRDIEADLERADAATAELETLNQLIEKQVQKGKDIATITEMLNAVCTDGAWGNDKFPTLQKMEDARASGTYLNLAYGVDFTLPKAIAQAQQMVNERDAAAEAEETAETKSDDSLWDRFNRFLASIGIPGLGSYGEEIDGMLTAQKDAYDANTIGKNYASKVLGIEIYGDLTAQEQALVDQTVDSVEIATKPRATAEEREAANVNIALLQGALTQAADDPNRQQQDSYKTKESWTSVAEQTEEEPREGMIEMEAEPTAYVEGMTTAQVDHVDEQATLNAYAQMCQGGEWDSGIFDWAMAQSNNPDAIWAEIGQGIIDHRTQGAELTGLAKSWWNKFGGLVDNIGYPTDYSQINDYEMHPENYDSRRAYGTQVYGALEMNEEAYRSGAIGAQQYADNLIRISDVADGISGMTNGERATDAQADQYISHTGASAILEKVYNICKSGMDAQSKQEEATRQQIYAQNEALIRQIAAGEPIMDEAAMWSILSADTSELRANDATYKDALNYIDHELNAEQIASSSINFTTGDANVDAAWGEEYVHNEGAMVYSQGVTALARAKLDSNLQFAAACGLTLEEYYAKFPEFARTPRQIVGEARAEYNNAWREFGGTLEALTKTNESFDGSNVEAAVQEGTGKTGEESLSFAETLALAVQKVDASNALDLEKTLYMMLYGWRDNAGRADLLRGQYSNDRSAYAADLDTWEASREAKLRDTYENDITAKQAGTSYEDWRAENSDQQLEEIRALRESSRDIFDIGLSIDELNAQQQIVQKTENTANVDKVIAEYGSKADQDVYNATASLAQSAQMMLTTALLGGGMGGTLTATAANAGGKAYDRFEASGDYDTALAASIGAWVVNAAIEKTSFDRFMPESLGGAMEQKVLAARSMLAREGVLGMIKSPKSLSKAAQGVVSMALKTATDSVGEGIEELLQSLTDSVADNIVYGESILPSAEQFKEAKEEGKAGFWMGAVMGVGSDLVFGMPKVTDYAGNAISKAEAILKPEHDGAILNSAIDFEARAMALANSQDALAKIEASSEYAQKQQAETELQAVEAEMAEAKTAYTDAKSAQETAVVALENANVEAQDADAFTEAMRKNMVAAAENLNATNERLKQAEADLSAAQAKQATAQQKLAAAQAIVQGMYNQTMDEAKAHYAQVVTEKYFEGDSEAQRAASEEYLSACRELDAAKALVRSTTPTSDGQSAHIDHGRALVAEDNAEAMVAEAKAQMDEAYAQTAEHKVAAAQSAELQEAADAAAQAEAAANAAPTDSRKRLAAEAAQAQYAAVQSQQELDNSRNDISARLKSPVPSEREQAVSEWKSLQDKARTATDRARQLTEQFNETDTQRDLRSAIENMRQYTNDDLIDTRSRNHEAASAAYAELQRAQAAVEIEQAWNDMLSGDGGVAAYQDARGKYDSAVGSPAIQNYANRNETANGDTDQRKPDIQEWRSVGGGWGDHRTPGKTGETTTAEHNPIEILDELTRRIRVGYNPGGDMSVNNRRLSAGVLGFYNLRAKSITTRTSAAGDLATALHEFGHAVQDRLSGLHANQQLIQALPQGVRNSYSQQALDGEAVAEFVVDYVFSRDEAIRQAGAQYVQDFEDMLRADKTLNEAIEYASTQTVLWNNADTSSKIGATIRDGNDPKRNRVGSWIQDTLRKVETAIADVTAPADLVSRDFRETALYSMHASNRADMCISRFMIDPQGRNIGQSLAERIYRAGVKGQADIDEVCRFALARHALDRRNENADVFSPEEFSTADLTAYIDETSSKRPNIVAGADALVSYWKDFMDAWWVETGMISEEDVREMRKKYPNYVPTFRVVGKNFAQYGGKSSRFQIRGVTKGGSSLEVINPINSIVRMTQQMVSTVSHNQMMREFHNEMRHGGLGYIADDVTQEVRLQTNDITRMQEALDAINDTGLVDTELMDDAYARMLELQHRWVGTGQNHGTNVVSGVSERGMPFFYKIKDEGLFQLLSGAAGKSGDMGAAMRTIRNFKNLFTQLTTGKNPGFALKNAIRDFQASVSTGTHSLTYADGMVRWVMAFHDVLTQSGAYSEWKAMGGGEHTRYSTGIDGSDARKATQEITDTLLRGKLTGKGEYVTKSTALDKISNVFTLEKLNTAIEDASRYVEYRFGKHNRSTAEGRQEAFMASQNVTTNFGTHGASRLIQIANNVVPFMNATIQGLNKDINLMRDLFSGLDSDNSDPARWRQAAPKLAKTMLNSMLTAMLQYGILKLAGGDEDDEDYALLSQEMRTGNLIIPISKGAMEVLGGIGFDRPYIRIPISQSPIARMLYSAGLDIAANVKDYSPLEVDMWRAVKSILGDSMIDGTVLQAFDDTRNNRTWYGGEIESEYMRNYSPENRYSNSTPQAIIELGAAIGVSPAKLEYLADQYSGFYGEIITPLISAGRLSGEYSLSESAKNLIYSMLRGYTIDPVSSNDINSSYSSAKTTISEIIADGKAGMAMNNLAYSADPEDAYSAAETLNLEFKALDKQIAAAWNEYNEIKRSAMSDNEKAAQMRAIRRETIVPLQMEALALYEEYKMQYIDADTLALEIYGRLPGGLKRPILD